MHYQNTIKWHIHHALKSLCLIVDLAEAYINKRYRFSLKIFTGGSKDASKALRGCAFVIPASLNYSQMFKLNEHLTVHYVNVSVLIKFSYKTSVFTLVITSSQ